MKFSSIISLSALLVTSTNAFTMIPAAPRVSSLASSTVENDQLQFVDDASTIDKATPSSLVLEEQETNMKPKPVEKAPKKLSGGGGGHKQGGIFAPVVKLAKIVLGEERLNKIRGKAIAKHSDVIRDFVETSDSEFGQRALETLFKLADADKSGRIDETELRSAMKFIGFNHLNDKQISGIFARADKDGDGTLDLDEFKDEAPKTLKTNLIKMAKSNGGELGFLA